MAFSFLSGFRVVMIEPATQLTSTSCPADKESQLSAAKQVHQSTAVTVNNNTINKDTVFTLKRWNLVAMWSWDVECEVCAICRTPLMGNSFVSSSLSVVEFASFVTSRLFDTFCRLLPEVPDRQQTRRLRG